MSKAYRTFETRSAKFVLFSLLIFVLLACRNTTESDEFPPMRFRVDTMLISDSIDVEGAFQMGIPVDWETADSTLFEMAKEIIGRDTLSPLNLELVAMFKSGGGATCGISRVQDESSLGDLLDPGFEELLAQTLGPKGVARAQFRVNGIPTVQFRIIGEDVITFKLFVEVESYKYQIDYVIPKHIYHSEVLKVESSIGSMKESRRED
jgi:hypothetical protein